MKTGCLVGIIAGILILIFSVVGLKWIIKSAFGPIEREVLLELHDEGKLLCKETYIADLADVFYDVNFKLISSENDTLDLGRGTFPSNEWDKFVELKRIGEWVVVPVNGSGYSKLLMNNWAENRKKEIEFSPIELKNNQLWKSRHKENPAWVHRGNSKIDSIVGNNIFVNYDYRIGLYEPFEFYNQTIQYQFDLIKEEIKTIKIFERKEMRTVANNG